MCVLWRDSTNTEEKDITSWVRALCSVCVSVGVLLWLWGSAESWAPKVWMCASVWCGVCVCVLGGATQYHSRSLGHTHCYKYSILMVTLWCCLCETMAPGGPLPHSSPLPSSPFPFSFFLVSPTIFSRFPSFRIYSLTGYNGAVNSPPSSAELFICRPRDRCSRWGPWLWR